MITKQDILEAIAECQGMRSPNANTAIKLAAFYTILDHLEDNEKSSGHDKNSFSGYSLLGPDSLNVQYDGNSDFAHAINGRKQSEIWPIMDDLMSTIQALNERLYSGVMRKLGR